MKYYIHLVRFRNRKSRLLLLNNHRELRNVAILPQIFLSGRLQVFINKFAVFHSSLFLTFRHSMRFQRPPRPPSKLFAKDSLSSYYSRDHWQRKIMNLLATKLWAVCFLNILLLFLWDFVWSSKVNWGQETWEEKQNRQTNNQRSTTVTFGYWLE